MIKFIRCLAAARLFGVLVIPISALPCLAQARPRELSMPGESFRGPLPELTEDEQNLRRVLKSHVEMLAGTIGERNIYRRPKALERAADYIENSLESHDYVVSRQKFKVDGEACSNLICERKGRDSPEELIVVGAHYDSVSHCPGANDNGSGVAALLALAEAWAEEEPERTLRFVAFVNEEAPYFQTSGMGSLIYARWCRLQKENVVGMMSLETIGYYSDRPGSQAYPATLARHYPSQGNFLGFVSNLNSEKLLRRAITSFRKQARFPSEGGALPAFLPGVGWSDHWSFWQQGYPAIMITDTAPFRYPHYHKPSDTPDKIDYDRLALVVAGIRHVVRDLTMAHSPR